MTLFGSFMLQMLHLRWQHWNTEKHVGFIGVLSMSRLPGSYKSKCHFWNTSFTSPSAKQTVLRKVPHGTKEVESNRLGMSSQSGENGASDTPTFYGEVKKGKGTRMEYQIEKDFETTKWTFDDANEYVSWGYPGRKRIPVNSRTPSQFCEEKGELRRLEKHFKDGCFAVVISKWQILCTDSKGYLANLHCYVN